MLTRLVAILGEDARKAFRGGRLAGWSADPHALGGYSIAMRPGGCARRACKAVANRLWFAGEASAGSGSMTAGGGAPSRRALAIEMIAKVI